MKIMVDVQSQMFLQMEYVLNALTATEIDAMLKDVWNKKRDHRLSRRIRNCD